MNIEISFKDGVSTLLFFGISGKLGDIPTAEQRAAVVAEVVQSVVRSASALLDPGCVYGAWLDLDGGWVSNR